MPDYKEMYLTLFRASEEAVNTLIAAQRACEEMYISQPEPEIVVLPFGEREEGGSGSCTLLEQYQKRGKNPPLFLQEKPAGYGAGREISWAKNKKPEQAIQSLLRCGSSKQYRCRSFRVCTHTQIEAQRSGFDLERRSSGVSVL